MGAQDHPVDPARNAPGAAHPVLDDRVQPMLSSGLIGVGYEGRTLEELVAHLLAMDVSRLVDVRLNPISRNPD